MGRTPLGGGGVVGSPGGREFFVWGAFILNEIWAQDKMYILVGTLLGWNILFINCDLVPILAPNYKQHILSPAKVSFLSVSQHAE
jgi:uncharacterized metal-binding protein